METIFACRGHVTKVQSDGRTSAFVALDPALKGADDAPVILMSADTQSQDATMPVAGLDDVKAIYVLGTSFTQITISGTALLGDGKADNAASYKAVVDWFDTNRVSKLMAPVSVSMTGIQAEKVYVTGLAFGTTDAQFHLKPFAITGIIAKTQKR